MTDNSESSNIEWKQIKNGEKKSNGSRRLDMKRNALSGKKSNELDVGIKRINAVTPNVKKMRNKIREVFDDEDEDEDDEINMTVFRNMDNEEFYSSLVNGLKEEEKKKLQSEETLHNQTMQHNAGKMEAITQLNKQLQDSGIKELNEKVVNQNMLRVETDEHTFSNTVKQHIAETEKISTSDVAGYQEAKDLIKGLGKVKQAELLSESIDDKKTDKLGAEELIDLGREKSDKKAAETIYYKTGRADRHSKEKSQQEKEQIKKKLEEAISQNTNKTRDDR